MTDCADRRRPAVESRPAHTSPNFGPTRKSAISGYIVGEIRESGFRGPVRMSYGGVCWIPARRFLTSPYRVYRRFPAKTGSGNRPAEPAGGGPHLRVAPPTNRPISGRRGNLRFPEAVSGKSGNRDFGISSGRHMRGANCAQAARFLPSPSHVLGGVSGENGARESANCADRRGSVFESGAAHKSPDFGPTPKSAISGDILGEIWKSGFRDLDGNPYGGVY